ncbi:MAG: GNAT family N-acetyltransferase [Candidatus Omnitrophota bacterium]
MNESKQNNNTTRQTILAALSYRETVNPDDADNVGNIVKSTGFFAEDEILIAVELVQERLEKGLPSGYHFLFADLNGRTVGYTCFGPIPATSCSYDLYWIAVHDEFRGMGIGKELLKRTEPLIAKLGGRRIYIETSSRDLYEPTRAFYLKCGYIQEAFLTDFYHPGDSKVIYVKTV